MMLQQFIRIGVNMTGDYTVSERALADRLIRENYDDLVTIARARRRRGRLNDTMCTIDLLHESFIRLNGKGQWESREHFINAVALAMRNVIIDHARKKQSLKRGNGAIKISVEEAEGLFPEFRETPEQLVGISNLMEKLSLENPRWMRIVDARYFSGLTENETANALKMSGRTVRRDWQQARAWLANELLVA